MKKIIPHIWFDKEAKVATSFYTTLFSDSKVVNVTTISGTPSGACDIVTFTLSGQKFMAISAGPIFKLNPSISMFVTFNSEEEINTAWEKLADGGKVLMAYDSYPWSKKYGWLVDKYGLSWQLSMNEQHQLKQKITPFLMFTQDKAGTTKDAIEYYTSIFPNSETVMLVPYEKGEGDIEGFIKHARFTLNGLDLMAMDSSAKHEFTFNEAVSLIISCDTQEEINHYWEKLSFVPESEQCGWLKDKYGVSWQIVPSALNTLLTSGTKEQSERVTQAFMKMKKFNIQALHDAFDGK